MEHIVLVDDEPEIVDIQNEALAVLDPKINKINRFFDPQAAWEFIQKNDVALVVTDWNMPEMTGMDLLFRIRGLQHPPYVIVLTAHGTIDRAVQAMNQGAFTFLEKPFDIARYLQEVQTALSRYRFSRPAETSPANAASIPRQTTRTKIPAVAEPVIHSDVMRRVYEAAHSAAESDSSVLLLGESGTGKEVLADYIHRHSARSAGPIVKVNCGALPEHLMESELFGHEKGAFTGADKRNIGRFEQANGGTLFLDEIGDLLPSLQVKLLRALQERTIERVGSSTPVRVDFRLVSATHRNIKAAVQTGTFRQDLYYRVNVVPIIIPPLRERPEDIQPLVEHFLSLLKPQQKRATLQFSPAAMAQLKAYAWPGNVRQLRNAVEYAIVLSKSEQLGIEDLPEEVRHQTPVATPAPSRTTVSSATESEIVSSTNAIQSVEPVQVVGLKDSARNAETELIVKTLNKHHWRITKVADELQISRSTLYQRMKEFGIKRP